MKLYTINMEFNKTYWRKLMKTQAFVDKKHRTSKQVDVFFGAIEDLDVWREARVIGLYSALPDEIETAKVIDKWSKYKKIVLPVVSETEMEFYEYKDELCRGAFGILEPKATNMVNPKDIDLLIIPGVAFDRAGNRLGRGKGYYDKYLVRTDAYMIGVAFSCQITPAIPCEKHDVKMDVVMAL